MKKEELKKSSLKQGGIKKVQPKTEREKMQDFLKEYRALCEKYQYQIVVNPAFRARDDGTWSIILQTSIGKLPKKILYERKI